ncbi:MAG: hypothetical protein U0271_43640 [Polyangiaceae bacterium]
MGTFLTTPKMSPELARRVEAAVRGRPLAQRSRIPPVLVTVLRVAAVAGLVALIIAFTTTRKKKRDELEGDRKRILDALHTRTDKLSDRDKELGARVEELLASRTGKYEGDLTSKELADPRALAALLAEPMVYVRGPIDAFSNHDVRERGGGFVPRPVRPLFARPPAKRTEAELLQPARAALIGGDRTARAAHVGRVHALLAAAPFLSPDWEKRVLSAESRGELGKLRAALTSSTLDEAVAVVRARGLLYVLDEPKEGSGPTELDGACAHHARMGYIDLESGSERFRARAFVDPAWLSESTRIQYADAVNGCELALAAREALTKEKVPR